MSQAYDFADKITDIAQNPKEALEKAGVTKEDLEKAKRLLNNPMAGFILGDKKQSVINGLSKAEDIFNGQVNSPTEQAPVSELEQLRENLARLK